MANSIPDDFIATLLNKVDIVDLIGSRVALQKKGKHYLAKCPFHLEKTPSFSVDPEKQFYHCFGCGVGGDAINFIKELDRVSFVEAVELLAAHVGLTIPQTNADLIVKEQATAEIYAVLATAAKFFQMQLKAHAAKTAVIDYLKARGLDGKIAKRFNLGYAPAGWDNLKRHILSSTAFTIEHLLQAGLVIKKENSSSTYDRFRNRIMFPIKDRRGRIVGFGGRVLTAQEEPKYLNSPETMVFNKGRELYGLYEARQVTKSLASIIVVEGYMDVLALAQQNIANVVAILGTALTFENIKLLFRIVPEIIFCFDADQAGFKAAWKALEVCLPNVRADIKVSFLFLPEAEDPDSYIRKYGRDKFLEQLKRAVTLADFFFRHLTKQMDLESTEDRANLVVRARELLQQIPDEVYKHMLFARLANLTSLDCAFLENVSTKTSQQNSSYKSKSVVKRPKMQLPKSPATIALALLLMYPQLITLLENFDIELYQKMELPGFKLFFAVATILKAKPNATVAEISAMLPSAIAKHFVPEELKANALFVPKVGIEKEFLGIIHKIKLLYDEQLLEALLLKAKTDGLTAAEKVQVQQLLITKNVSFIAE